MNSKILASLGVVIILVGLTSKADAQSRATPNSSTNADKIQGDSLTGIDNRTAENDFARFFAEQNSQNNALRSNFGDSISSGNVLQLGDQFELRRNNSVTAPNDIIFPRGEESFYGTEGVQVQFDLDRNSSTNRERNR
jgi:hypothetical protein